MVESQLREKNIYYKCFVFGPNILMYCIWTKCIPYMFWNKNVIYKMYVFYKILYTVCISFVLCVFIIKKINWIFDALNKKHKFWSIVFCQIKILTHVNQRYFTSSTPAQTVKNPPGVLLYIFIIFQTSYMINKNWAWQGLEALTHTHAGTNMFFLVVPVLWIRIRIKKGLPDPH